MDPCDAGNYELPHMDLHCLQIQLHFNSAAVSIVSLSALSENKEKHHVWNSFVFLISPQKAYIISPPKACSKHFELPFSRPTLIKTSAHDLNKDKIWPVHFCRPFLDSKELLTRQWSNNLTISIIP